MRKIYILILTSLVTALSAIGQTVTINCTGTAGSFNSGYVTNGGTKNDGNLIVDGAGTLRRGWASFDLSSIPSGSTVTAVSLKFTVTSNNALSTVNNGIYGFTSSPAAVAGTTLYANCASGTNFNNAAWTQNTTNTLGFNAAGIAFITGRLGTSCNIGLVRGAGSAIFNINGYPGATPPQLVITYTPPAYRAQFISMNTGAASWCAGETRNISVTVKNVGTATWTNAGPNPINLGVKWNTNGGNWTDYHIRTSANNLAPGATATYNVNLTASNNAGGGYTTPLAAGSNNITFDLVREGISWFANNAGGVGPGNTVFTSPAVTIVASPAAPTGATAQSFCASNNPTVSNLTATGLNIKWYDAASGGNLLAPGTALVSGNHYYATQTNGSGCESNSRLDVTVTLNANTSIGLSSAVGTDNQVICLGTPITPVTYAIAGAGLGGSVTGLPAGLSGNFAAGVFTISGSPTVAGTSNYTVTATGTCLTATASGTITVTDNGTLTLTSPLGTDAQSICPGGILTPIEYTIGGTASGAILSGTLPSGVTGSFAGGIFSISGTPTGPGLYNYTVTTTGSGCANLSVSGTMAVNEDAGIALSSAAGTDAQAICALQPITDITYSIAGFGVTGATVTGLPAGVTGSYNAGVYTISGAPATTGTFNYTVTTTGPCVNASLSGTITSNNNGTVVLSSAAGTDAQAVCSGNAITDITYDVDPSATSASITAGSLPAGVSGSFAGGVFTISGVPTEAGIFNFTVTASGSACANFSASGAITVNENGTISLSSAAGTDLQTICISTAISPISYTVGGFGITGAVAAGLPAGITGSYAAGIFSISGTPAVSGIFNYTVTTTGPCVNASSTGTITVDANSTLSLTSGTASQTKCINTALTSVVYTLGGGATGAVLSAGSLPPGVTGIFAAGEFTISGTPTVSGVFPYTVSATGPCVNPALSGTITVQADATITLTSAPATTSQSLCISTALTPITYSIGGGGTGATVIGLPTGVTGTFSAGVYTISGTPTAAGTFNYTVSTTGPCVKPTATGTIIVTGNATLTLSSGAGTNNQTRCINVALTNITFNVGGSGTGASLSSGSFPAGVTGNFSGGVFTISGTPTVSGSFPYTITASGPCVTPSLSGTITVNADATITFTSGAGTDAQVKCISTPITPITYAIGGGGTGATVTGLPTGVTGAYSAGVYTISGTPLAAGTFNYTVTTTGPCVKPTATGFITVTPNATITRTSTAATTAQTVCINTAITNITYSIAGSGTGASLTAGSFPAGVAGSFAAGVYTISGTPTVSGTFPYTISTSGPCGNVSTSGTITVNADATIALNSAPATTSQTLCISTGITPISYILGGGATGATVTGLPTGVTGSYNSGTKIYTISGSPSVAGTFNYTVTSSGPCVRPALGGTITVTPNATISLSSGVGSNVQTICTNSAITNITYNIGGSGTGATASNLPPGVTGSFAGGVYTISGAPTAPGTYNFVVTTTGPCVKPSLSGILTVNAQPAGSISASENSGTPNNNIICAGANVTFSATAGFGSYIFKVNGTTVQSGISNVYSSSTLTNGASITADVANGLNCGATFGPVVITVNALPIPTLIASQTTICPGDNVTFTATGGTSYSFKVNGTTVQSGASATYSSTTLTNGNSVTVTVTNANGCAATSTPVVITVNTLPTGTLTASPTAICTGETLVFTATASYSNYHFKVNGTTVQNSASNIFSSNTLTNPSVVTVEVTNASNCVATFNPIVVTVNDLPTGTLTATENSGTPDDNSICSGSEVVFTATPGYSSYDFMVNGVSQQLSASNSFTNSALLDNDVVTVTAINGTNCSATFNSITITVAPSPVGSLTSTNPTICAGENIEFTATPGYANYDFMVNGVTVQNGAANTFNSIILADADVVSVTVTGANSCSATFNSITVVVAAQPSGILAISENSGSVNDDGIICTGAPVTFNAPAGFANYNFLLNAISVQNGPSATYTNSSLATGDQVTVAITNAGNCIGLLNTWTITVNNYSTVDPVTGPSAVCGNETITLLNNTPAGVWSSNNASVATVDASGIVTGITAGNAVIDYAVTNANGCTTTASALVTVNPLPVVAPITGTTSVCESATTQLSSLTAAGTWTSDNTLVATVDVNGLVTAVAAGTANISYSLTNAFNCTTTNTVVVTVNATPVLNPITGNLNLCMGSNSQLANDTDGGTWSSSNTAVATVNSSTGLVSPVSAGTSTISYTITDGNTCSATVTAIVNVFALPVPTLAGPNPICPNSTGTYSTEAGQSNYSWVFTGGTLVAGGTSTDNTITILWDQAGPKTIFVNYQDANGCTGATSATVTTGTGVIPTLTGNTEVCKDADGNYLTEAGNSDYAWTIVGGVISSGGTATDNTATITWNVPGTGSVSINYTDAGGCTAITPVVLPVLVHTLPTASVSGNNSVCLNAASPLVTFTGANGTAPYTFTYNIDGGSDQTITTVSGNSVTLAVPTTATGSFVYTLTNVSDANTCGQAQTGSVTIVVNELAAGTISGSTTVCQNATSPLISFTGTTGTAPFTFSYNINGGGTQTITTVSGNSVTLSAPTNASGTFTYNLLSVTDANNCSQVQSGSATINVDLTPTAAISGSASVCVNGALPVITFTGANGTAPYVFTYNINGGGNLTAISVGNTATVSVPTTVAGTFNYTLVSVSDAGAGLCSQAQTGTATVIVSSATIAGSVGTSTSVCSGSNAGTLTLTGHTGNVTGWEFSTNGGATWTPVNNTTTTLNYSNLTNTTIYHAIVQNGVCAAAASANATITVNQPSVGGTVGTSTTVCSGSNSGTLTLTGHTGSVIRWEFSTNAGATWSPIANTTTSLNYTNVATATLYRAVVANGACASVNSAAASISITSLPTATVSGTASVCLGATSPVITFTGANGVAPYTFTYRINAGANQTVISTGNVATINAPTGVAGVFNYSLVSVSSTAGCSQNQTGSAVVTVNAVPTAFTITPSSVSICQGSIQSLSASVGLPTAASQTFASGTVNISIPNEGNRSNTIAVTGIPAGAIITGATIAFNVTHGAVGELVVNLTAPNGNTLNLVDERGGTGNNFVNTRISSTTAVPVNGSAPFTNIFAPDAHNGVGNPNANIGSFAGLYGTPNGNWTINVEDGVDCNGIEIFGVCLGSTYSGVLNSWTVTLTYTVPAVPVSAVWTPATNLFTDPGATIAYSGQALSTVYVKPATGGSVLYTATATNGAGCTATQTVNVTASPIPAVNITSDYCAVPGKVVLTANSTPVATSYIWNTGATTQSIQVDIAGTFEVTAFAGGGCPGVAVINIAQELVVNGDFEAGNVGFITPPLGGNQYQYVADGPATNELNPEGLYGIGPDAHTYHNGFWGHDHTTGSGNFMIINGFPNGNPQPIVWQQTVNVLPNTTYYFSGWGMSVNSSGPFAQLQFNVNGAQVGSVATLPAGVNNNSNNGWVRFYGTWTSGPTTTTAVISITDLQNAAGGNDFGLDDISFATLSTFITLESAPGTDAQVLCQNTPLTNIVYNVGNGSPTGPIVAGLPAGVTSVFSGDQVTISGTPTTPGSYTYTLTTTGSCLPTTASGTITVQGQGIALTSGTANTIVCQSAAVNIGYTLSGTATGATFTGLPAGVTGTVSGTSVTISGTPTVAGSYPYTINTTGTCAPTSISGSITVQSQTISLNSANNNQTRCVNTAIGNIQYTVGGTATGVTVTGLPAGVTFSYNSGIVFITGTPTVAGTFNYTVNTTGPCSSVSATGTLIINPAAAFVLTSAVGTNNQLACRNAAITTITYAVNNATGATVTGLPAGVTGVYSAGVFTISGTPTANGVFNYTITSSGGCGSATATGTITVQGQTITLTAGNASPSVCVNSAPGNIVYSFGGTATGATVTGLPAGLGFNVVGNLLTISGTATVPGTFTYTVTTTGTCAAATATGTISVQPGAVGGAVASVAICSGGSGTLTVTGQTGSIVRWEFSINGGSTWTPIVNNTITQAYNNITDPTLYRAVLTNGCGLAYSTAANIAIRNYWTGTTSTDWHTASNWADNQVPSTFCANVYIKGGMPFQPTLGSGVAVIENLHVYPAAVLTIDNGTLRISGTIFNTGTILAGTGTVDFNSTSTQTIAAATFTNNAVGNLVISNSSATGVSLAGPVDVYRSLTFTGTGRKFNTGGHLTLKSTASETAWVGDVTGNIVTGEAMVERFIATGTASGEHGKSWQLLATPTTGQTIKQAWQEGAVTVNGNPNPGFGTMLTSNVPGAATQPDPGFDAFTAPGPSIKTYNSTTNLYDGPASTNIPLYNPKGYFILVRGDRSVTAYNQASNNTVLRSKGLLFTPSNPPAVTTVPANKFESVGNPYASAVDLRSIVRTGGVNEFFYVWDPRLGGANNLGGFQTLLKVGSDYFAIPGGGSYGSGVNNYIQSGQAFLVQSTGSAGTVGFTETSKAPGSALHFRGQQAPSLGKMIKTNLYSVAADGSTSLLDGMLNLFDNSYSNDIDGFDARKTTNTGENLSVKTNSSLLAVQRRQEIAGADTIFLNLANVRVQNYSLEFTSELGNDVEGFIEDTYLNTRTMLNTTGTTTVNFNIANVPGSYAANRFRIVFTKILVVPVTFTSVKAYQHGKNINVEWKTDNELNIEEYIVEKSANGSNFGSIGTRVAIANNGSSANYSFVDAQPLPGFNFYRITSVDAGGKKKVSEIVKVFVETVASDISIYPNPISNGIVNLQLKNQPAGIYSVKLMNKIGQVILTRQIDHAEGTSTEKIKWDYSLAHGMYLLEVLQPNGKKTVIKVLY